MKQNLLELLKETNSSPTVYGHKEEALMRQSIEMQAQMFGVNQSDFRNLPEPDVYLEDGMLLDLGDIQFKALFTPGHAPGHIAFYSEPGEETEIIWGHERLVTRDPILLAGDTLFEQSIGRTDLPMANHDQLINSIKSQLLTLPKTTLVCPGHGPNTTIENEAKSNPFLN